MNLIITIFQIIISIALSTVILLQARGGGLGSAFGSSTFTRTRRGAEKFMFNVTVALSIAFVLISFANILFS
jgi:preprotein translocase subunit SecG